MLPIAILLLLAGGRYRPAPHPPPARILWIGAHPDDESLVAPLLGNACVENNDLCAFLVMTRGEGGGDPAIRSSEMLRAADFFHAHLDQWDFSDVMADVDATWSAQAGGHEALVGRLTSEIIQERPAVIYTFDPNHGSSCHPAHRAVGALVIEAAVRLGVTAPRLQFVETTIEYLPDGFIFGSATPDAMTIDATNTWHYLVDDAAIHASQFAPAQIEALRTLSADERRVYLASVPAQKYSCDK